MGKRLLFGILVLFWMTSFCWAIEGTPMTAPGAVPLAQPVTVGTATSGDQARDELGTVAPAVVLPLAELPPVTQPGESPAVSPAEKFFLKEINQPATSPRQQPNGPLPKAPVAGASRALKQFGYDFFNGSTGLNEGFAMADADYLLGPGDTLRIDLWGTLDGSHQVVIDRGGNIHLPKVGTISLWGKNLQQAREKLDQQIKKYYSGYDFNLSLTELRAIQVFIVGEVERPGAYMVSGVSSLLTALNEAGGVRKQGSLRKIRLNRQGQADRNVDLYDFLLTGDRSDDFRLQAGDTLFVPVVGTLVGVAGDVRRPGIYEILEGDNLNTLLGLSGGVIASGYLQKVQVQRILAHEKKTIIDIDLSSVAGTEPSLDNLVLQDRDMVLVEPISATGGYVTLRGYVVRPGEYQFLSGMRLSDLILPYDNLLPEFYPRIAQIVRISPPQYDPEILTVDLALALAGDPEQNLLLQEYDQVKLFSRQQMQEEVEVKVSGAVQNPGSFKLLKNMTVRDLVAMAGNLKRRAYADQAELTRFVSGDEGVKVERQLINLDQALAGDPGQNLVLKADDHLFVRAIPDFNSPQNVTIQGEVLYPGTYAITKGETLSSVLERAGGYSDDAYLRGAVFSRESLKEDQRKRVQQLIREQEEEIARVSSMIALGSSDKASAERAQATLEFRQQLIRKLQETPLTGRMVVQLVPLDELKDSENNPILMDGDMVNIPTNPRSVGVFGEVYNPTALSYVSNETVGFYLAKVGGATGRANEDEMFVVRADGTVVSNAQTSFGLHWDQDNRRWSSGGLEGAELYPGDTLLVPEEFDQLDIMSTVKDISTIIYQMALGAAAVASF
jgi:protein involved in polysaccharide export with SLBB domain